MRNLEARLGVKLLNRTSRSVDPTDAGAALAARLAQGFDVIGRALDELDAYRASPVGRLRLNVPRDASRLLLSPVLRRFTDAYPDLKLEVSIEDRMVDIVADGYDAGMRYGPTVPQDMVAVPLTGELRWIVVGSDDYLARRGVPRMPDDLLGHACVRMRLGDDSFYKWELGDGARRVEVDVPGPVSVNETDAAVAAALDGVALAYCLEVRVADELRAGRLRQVLPDWACTGPPLCLYYPSRRQSQPGLRQLAQMIREYWAAAAPKAGAAKAAVRAPRPAAAAGAQRPKRRARA